VGGAAPADTPVQVVLRRGANEVVIATRVELQATGLRRKWPECYGEVQHRGGLVAYRYDPWTRIRYSTRLVLLLRHLYGKGRR
jgi:hypothetical protein